MWKHTTNVYADMGIRTPVVGVKGRHDWPDYTISACASKCLLLYLKIYW